MVGEVQQCKTKTVVGEKRGVNDLNVDISYLDEVWARNLAK